MKKMNPIDTTSARSVYDGMVDALFGNRPLDDLPRLIDTAFLGYGTAAHESFSSAEDVLNMAQMQTEQLQGQEFTLIQKPVSEKTLAGGALVLIVEEYDMHIKAIDHRLHVRLTSLLEKKAGHWKIVHFHGSTPDSDIAEEEAFPMEGLKRKNEELEAKIRERTRELELEAALEKVRARTMAMQTSDELAEASHLLDKEVRALGIETWGCAFHIYGENESTEWFSSEAGLMDAYPVPRENVFKRYYEVGKQGVKLYKEAFEGETCSRHYEYLCTLPVLGDLLNGIIDSGGSFPEKQYDHVAYFKYGHLLFITLNPVGPEVEKVFVRFAEVFEQTYTRFLDLKNMESQGREARIETALERVRARALAMQQPEELKDVAQVLRHEMGLLGVEELETSSIYINDQESRQTECWYAIKDIREQQKVMVADHFALDLHDTWVGREMLKFFDSDADQASIIMKGKRRREWIDYCEAQSEPLRGYYGNEVPDRTYHLYKFSHGAIGVATAGALSGESWGLLRRAASVFSLAYSRFRDLTQARLDLKKLKEEKKRAEDALAELQLTQKQLVHAEKMASLGELTAGIAHEIQNPLNFVNNFSEVSTELLAEMYEELEKGNLEEARAIAEDLRQNLEKITHHGKRADGIVKGMLQHSRSGDGKKQPTDLNKLADEYLRLAYHGLRAKDKSFNAKMETDFDPEVGLVEVVPQDIGRVLLNLLTNAFHAVGERKQNDNGQYDPTVWLRTQKTGQGIEMVVSDNGGGIPLAIRDKIFQPFFTTKPTGQGTGLGLSMSYDIITKGHGGELTVASEAARGTTFTVVLPNKTKEPIRQA